jgi:phosphonate transport system substrate-binding protein
MLAAKFVERLGAGEHHDVWRRHPWALDEWQHYLSVRLKRPVEFVNRETYREMIDLIRHRLIEFAWLSDYPYAYLARRGRVKLLLTPVSRHQGDAYAAYLIVPATDTRTQDLADLRGRVFAFTDPYSLTGYQITRATLQGLGERDPAHFFRKTFFTRSHHNTMTAVAVGLADGAMVDSYAWHMTAEREPELTKEIRVVTRSVDFGFPPIVSVPTVPAGDVAAMRNALLSMQHEPDGQRLLQRVGLTGFKIGDPKRYRNVFDLLNAADKP